MNTLNIPQAVYDMLQRSFSRVERSDCGRIFVHLCSCTIEIDFSGEDNQDIQMQLRFPKLSSKKLVRFAYDACLVLNPSSLSKLVVVNDGTDEFLIAFLNDSFYSNDDASDFVCEGLNILQATYMQVDEFMSEYFGLNSDNEIEIESIIRD